ncbi:hypothetical protein ACWEO4_23365 [Streptomyces sp. NPDC004393]|uniref:hypothetical protein n=1 Tax=Streptomyces sp. NPDC004533 TaxID=3154278 RepID=UPI0033A70728
MEGQKDQVRDGRRCSQKGQHPSRHGPRPTPPAVLRRAVLDVRPHDAADRDYRVYVLTDGIADSDPETHQVLVDEVFPSRAHLIDTTGLRELLQSA